MKRFVLNKKYTICIYQHNSTLYFLDLFIDSIYNFRFYIRFENDKFKFKLIIPEVDNDLIESLLENNIIIINDSKITSFIRVYFVELSTKVLLELI